MMDVETQIRELATKYAQALEQKVTERLTAMEEDDQSHFLLYRVLGVSLQEGKAIDMYQNKGRFLYRYAGAFLESATKICFKAKFPETISQKIPNTLGQRPATFEIDCLVGDIAYEVKWRDATTDGDHITKEHTRIKVIAQAGYVPVRLMYYYPNRIQARRIQAVVQDLYKANGGTYYFADAAWNHVNITTGINLLAILQKIADEMTE